MRFAALPPGAAFRSKLVPAVVVVALGDWIFYQRGLLGGNCSFFGWALLAAMLVGRPAVRRDRRAWIALLAAALFAFAYLCDPSLLAWTLFWVTAGMATLLPATARFDDGWRWLQRLVWQAVCVPFGPLIDLVRLGRVRGKGRAARTNLRAGIALLALPLGGSAVILTLFAAANPLVEQALSALVPDISLMLVPRAMLWTVLFVMAWSLLRPRIARRLLPGLDRAGAGALPGVSVASVTLSLVVFNAIFAVQNLLDAAYLWGLAPLPEGMTLAGYAHRGAYPLIATALLAAAFVLVTLRPGSDTARSPTIRRLVTAWIVQNVFLVASSMLRTLDYVEVYSLTRLRIAALAWMALVGFGLAAICWRLLRGRSGAWLVNVNGVAAALVLTVACFVDLDAVAARWNVRHAREVGGSGAALDLCYLSDLGDSSVLALVELERRPGLDPALRERVRAVALDRIAGLEQGQRFGWTLLGQRRLAAVRGDRERLGPPPRWGERGCDGALIPPRPLTDPAPEQPTLTGARGK
ncbi:DUF4173 domain-containing protein [Novosphingobium resinovorum]|uniref:DUF4153 domain-containing protein n=1 Tax=Novosphingobium resinovorum TaxID=158500 RepID=UPI002ECFCDCC|nr:DUF4173 domain-containing protein [Novosphingobium resinovorum]